MFDMKRIEGVLLGMFPGVEIVSMKLIGSSALSPEEQVVQDIAKHGRVQEDRDIDVEVVVKGLTEDDIEKWIFSDEAEELERLYKYDVQLRSI